ncbi:hypothetical protein GEV33_006168 [Tenebrio molitor]|uniref:Regulatory protein zeste n=1 Tax=Tenebrio molitor TaxID=7067 RepID=A0A8J6LEJ8_TENMO|nr:hypothetical protein GEV33_006168 [Tenebrio molitor]
MQVQSRALRQAQQVGRPSVRWDELTHPSKQRRAEAEPSTTELVYATQMSMRAAGPLGASKVVKDIVEGSPSQLTSVPESKVHRPLNRTGDPMRDWARQRPGDGSITIVSGSSPDAVDVFTTSPAPPREDTSGHRARQGGGEPRLRTSSARLPPHPPKPCTILVRPLSAPLDHPNEDRKYRARSNRYTIVPHPARCPNLASHPYTKTNKCCFVPALLSLTLLSRSPIQAEFVCDRPLWVVMIKRVRLCSQRDRKQKTGNFYCIVDYPYWGHHVKKRALLLFPCGGVEKSKKYKNNKNARFLHAMCKTTHFRVKKRSKNFKVEETAVLVEEVEKRRALLFGPLKGPNLTQFHRDRGWQQVVDAVNAVAPTVRTAAELRSKFKDLKTRAKHRVNAVKREGRKTGGGQNEANTPLSAIDAKLSQFIGADSIEGIAGGVDPFRRQVINPGPSTSIAHIPDVIIFEPIPERPPLVDLPSSSLNPVDTNEGITPIFYTNPKTTPTSQTRQKKDDRGGTKRSRGNDMLAKRNQPNLGRVGF